MYPRHSASRNLVDEPGFRTRLCAPVLRIRLLKAIAIMDRNRRDKGLEQWSERLLRDVSKTVTWKSVSSSTSLPPNRWHEDRHGHCLMPVPSRSSDLVPGLDLATTESLRYISIALV